MIYNHYSPRLSEIDKLIVKAVPPGGNWKDVPENIPSLRLKKIRESFKRGEGSRSTYYGRLLPNMPSYTMTTYISRPGNGCHIHYDQDRLISQREGARLQSFPDSFVFEGSKTSINTQIGNAVPPLLAYQVANQLGEPGLFIDLFSGAGGLALGFEWAGWKPLVANDIDPIFLQTHSRNLHSKTIIGDIRDAKIFDELLTCGLEARKSNKRLFVIGGPPCQGFSTAGNKRSLVDPRNHLFKDFVRFIDLVGADGFVFENVIGLTNMDGGKVFQLVQDALQTVCAKMDVRRVAANEYGVPQRRNRIMIVGTNDSNDTLEMPPAICRNLKAKDSNLRQPISVKEAIGDLPAIAAGKVVENLDYRFEPQNSYQKLMRGFITAEEFVSEVRKLNESLSVKPSRTAA